MTHEHHSPHKRDAHTGTLGAYILGFVVSVVFTVTAFALTESNISGTSSFHSETIVAIVVILAIAQLCVQLIAFLHLGRESRPRWNLIIFSYAAVLLIALVLGTLWIMNNLSRNTHMTPEEMNTYMLDQ